MLNFGWLMSGDYKTTTESVLKEDGGSAWGTGKHLYIFNIFISLKEPR